MRAHEDVLLGESTGLQECLERVLEAQASSRPISSYRLQFHAGFRFQDAQELIPYLHKLGVSHLYSSPLLKARSGSTHGYDIADHNSLNPEIGSEDEFYALTAGLKARKMGLILDTVPNHMGIGKGDNQWWQDVLMHGRTSEYADFFDIDWDPLKPELRNKVLLPILGSQYGNELEAGHIVLHFREGSFGFTYSDNKLPIDPQTIPLIFASVPAKRRAPEFASLLRQLQDLPDHNAVQPESIERRRQMAPILQERFARLIEGSSTLQVVVQKAVSEVNGIPGTPGSFDNLHRLLEAQAFRLAHWRVSAEEINYRRFFDINDLVGLCMENPRVFALTHKLLRRLMAERSIDGLRIDHCDGLLNPRQYLIRAQMLFFASQCCGPEPTAKVAENGIEHDVQQFLGMTQQMQGGRLAPLYCLVEKILEPGESLPAEWPVDGTSGYDFINQVNGILIQSRNEGAFTNFYKRFVGDSADFDTALYHSKKNIMHTALSSEVNVLAHILDTISSTDRHARDYTRKTLRDAIRETIACFPVYRSYIDERGEINDRDRTYINTAIRRAKRVNSGTAAAVFDFLGSILLTEKLAARADQEYRLKLHFILKFQQLTGPVMAKGLEDTSFYIYNRFISLNEVGCLPRNFGTKVPEFHDANLRRLEGWPNSMISTSTHDTKRSEDVRARLNVLSELPKEWSAKVMSWRRLNEKKRITLSDGRKVPDANEEYFLYQTLIGAWPFGMRSEAPEEEFVERIRQYMNKAVHEAKVNVSWVNPDPEYTDALLSFVSSILAPSLPMRTNFFLRRLETILPMTQFFGAINSLAQAVLKITSPGMPDIYQGNELWDLSLVDPDNRRPVDFDLRSRLLDELSSVPASERVNLCHELLTHYQDGRVKLWTTMRALRFRRANAELFQKGSYLPLEAIGEKQENVCAFARELGFQDQSQAIVVTPLLSCSMMKGVLHAPLGDVWGRSELLLPHTQARSFENIFTGERIGASENGTLLLRDVFRSFPVAILTSG